MPPIPVALPKSTFPGNRPQEARGILVNCYAEPDGEDGDLRIVRDAGIKLFGTNPGGEFRGAVTVPGSLYAVVGTKVYQYSQAGGAGVQLPGSVPGEGPVFIARNNATIPDIVVVAPGEGAFVIASGAVLAYPDTDVGQPNSVCIFNQFFFFSYGDGTMTASSPGTLDISQLDDAEAEYKPDTLYRVVPAGGVLLAFGSSSIEVWGGSVSDPPGFPYARMQGIDRGLIGPNALSGHQDGFGGGIIFVGDDNGVYQFTSGSPNKISPPDLDRLIQNVADKTKIEVLTYGARGHLLAVVQCDEWSWCFDLNTQKWRIRRSYLAPRWRATQAVNAFGKWIVGDRTTGSLGYIDSDTRTEYGEPLRYSVETAPQPTAGSQRFPKRMRVNRIHVYATVGAGIATGADPIETDPTIEIEVSGDGGLTWCIPRQCKIGRQAIGRQSIAANNFGHSTAQGFRVRLSIADPVDVSIMGAAAEVRELAA